MTTFDVAVEAAALGRLEQAWSRIAHPGAESLSGAEVRRLAEIERRLRRSGRWVSGPTTLFEVLGATSDEVRNCRVVRWLLDPLAAHGLGGDALGRFLGDLRLRAASASMPVPAFENAQDAVLVVEDPRADTRADLLIYGPGWTVVIEAKIYAGEMRNQGARLSKHWPGATYVFLTVTGAEILSADPDIPWISFTWADLIGHVEAAAATAGPPPNDAAS